jgi:hypothetical protein
MKPSWTIYFVRDMTKISLSFFWKKFHVIKIKLYDYGSESIGKKPNT